MQSLVKFLNGGFFASRFSADIFSSAVYDLCSVDTEKISVLLTLRDLEDFGFRRKQQRLVIL